jgi:UDP-glucose 4-epimerase
MRVLVTGGVGYIGSHTCVELLEAGHEVFVIDNLSNGHKVALDGIQNITNCNLAFKNIDIRETKSLHKVFSTFKPDAVIHFAGLKAVGESVVEPIMYYDVNVGGSISLLDAMTKAGCNCIIFSSSATVYGDPEYLPYDELHPTNPINPYGRTKLMVEEIISDWVKVSAKRKGIALRYFNPVGAHRSGKIGEKPNGVPNNLMPYLAQVAIGQRKYLNIFGSDYKTKDGTGLRDYIHIVDLAEAHVKALENQKNMTSYEVINIGCGVGVSVLELIKNFESVSGVELKYKFIERRPGDLPAFWANASKAYKLFGWKPKLNVLQMCEDTWRWQKNNLKRFNSKEQISKNR